MRTSQIHVPMECVPVKRSEEACERKKNKIVIGNIETKVHWGYLQSYILIPGFYNRVRDSIGGSGVDR